MKYRSRLALALVLSALFGGVITEIAIRLHLRFF